LAERELDEYDGKELDHLELQKVRRMLADHDRAHWLWGTLTRAALAAGALATAAVAVKTWLINGGSH
jgi:hypothetical protein